MSTGHVELRKRLQRLEAAARMPNEVEARRREELKRQAICDLWDVIEVHYPPIPGLCRPYMATSTEAQALAAAQRFQSGLPTEQDRAALAAMPADALHDFGHPAEVFIAMVGALPEMTPALMGEVNSYAKGMHSAS